LAACALGNNEKVVKAEIANRAIIIGISVIVSSILYISYVTGR